MKAEFRVMRDGTDTGETVTKEMMVSEENAHKLIEIVVMSGAPFEVFESLLSILENASVDALENLLLVLRDVTRTKVKDELRKEGATKKFIKNLEDQIEG